MRLPKTWLQDYVDFNVTDEEFIERMMWRGFELEGVEKELAGVSGVITGKILSMEKHPNADKLTVCQVDIGGKTAQILTNATNVFVGAVVPVAYAGAKIGSHEFTVANIRGVESQGMFCSGQEFNLSDVEYPGAEVDGILILREDTPLGIPIEEAIDRNDVIFDFSVLPNRPDCNSIIGLVREAAAALGQKMKTPIIPHIEGEGDVNDIMKVTVENGDLCPRYTGRAAVDLKIGPSPAWMQRRLKQMGMRPISNIVDITNYVLVEYGHPTHAFDAACIRDGHIIVRNAKEGEVVVTLDKKERVMDKDMLLISDPQGGVGVAGVMGGLNSEITENTQAVFFESAASKASNIRRTARKLRHVTDAAARFIKGVEPVNAYLALERCIELVSELHAGRIVGGTIDVCSADLVDREIDVDVSHVNRILNTELSGDEMAKLLDTIEVPAKASGNNLHVVIPHYRTDIESGIEADADIAEEVGRIYGFENIPAVLMNGDTFQGSLAREFQAEDKTKDVLVACGCLEMYNYNFTGPNALKALSFAEGDERNNAVKLLNPFGEDQSLMRTTLYMGMLDSAARNIRRKTGYGRFMEVGNVHFDLGGDLLPREEKKIGLIFFGEQESFYTLKGVIETLLGRFGIRGVKFEKNGIDCFQPGRRADVKVDGKKLGELGQVHPDVLNVWDVPGPVYMAELSFSAILGLSVDTPAFQPLPRFPVVSRDLAIVVPEESESAHWIEIIEKAPVDVIVEKGRLFDVYRGPAVGLGKKSLAITFSLRAEDHTLTDEEIKKAFETIIRVLAENGAPLRQ